MAQYSPLTIADFEKYVRYCVKREIQPTFLGFVEWWNGEPLDLEPWRGERKPLN